jgi:hypothetical protein
VEVDRISAQLKCLADVEEFSVKNAPDARFVFRVVNHDVSTVLILWGSFRIALILNVSRKKSDFGTHLNEVAARAVLFSLGVMLVN